MRCVRGMTATPQPIPNNDTSAACGNTRKRPLQPSHHAVLCLIATIHGMLLVSLSVMAMFLEQREQANSVRKNFGELLEDAVHLLVTHTFEVHWNQDPRASRKVDCGTFAFQQCMFHPFVHANKVGHASLGGQSRMAPWHITSPCLRVCEVAASTRIHQQPCCQIAVAM